MLPKSLYIDKSGFEYDLSPLNYALLPDDYVAGTGYVPPTDYIIPSEYVRPASFILPSGLVFLANQDVEAFTGENNESGVYELDSLLAPMVQTAKQYNGWSSWLDKFQPDYRFIAVSDMNAEAYLFPNVDDPWMFTEYVFEGKDVDRIVEPELYDATDLHQINETVMRQISPSGWGVDYPTQNDGVKLYKTDVKVQCVKWGEHGNIPPKTINMTAPRNWIDSSVAAGVKRIVPVITSSVGFAQYADSSSLPGIVTAVDVDSISIGGVKQANPRLVRNDIIDGAGHTSAKFCSGGYIVGELVHEGCDFWKDALHDGTGDCSLKTSLPPEEVVKLLPNYAKCTSKISSTTGGNPTCPYWRQKQLPVEIGTWSAVATSSEEWRRIYAGTGAGVGWRNASDATDLMALPLGAGTLSYGLAATGFWPLTQQQFDAPREFADNNVRSIITYEIQNVTLETKEVYNLLGKNSTRPDLDKYIRIKRNTGIMALDEIGKSDVYPGVDPVFYGDIEQTSHHRWFNNIMHCQDCRYCNDIYGFGMTQGFDPYNRMVSNTGVVNSQFCKYYVDYSKSTVGGGCAYNSVPKMAFEFQEIMANSVVYVIPLVSAYLPYNKITLPATVGVKTLRAKGYFGDADIEAIEYGNHYLLVSDVNKSDKMGGVDCSNIINGKYVIAHFTITDAVPTIDGESYTLKDAYFYIKMYFDNGTPSPKNPWLVKIDRDFYKTSGFCIHIENDEKFIGGHHPEYKDLSKRKNEVMVIVGGGTVYQGEYGVGDPDYWGQKESGFYQGYNPDKWGEWVLDGRSIGENPPTEPFVSWIDKGARASIIPGFARGGTPITGNVSNTIISPDKTVKARIINANVYSCDTVDTLLAIKDLEYDDPDGEGDSYKAPPTYNQHLIPTSRTVPHCPVDDLYFNEVFEGAKCTWCGATLEMVKPPLKFPIVKAIGRANVYAMAGSTIKGDAYFWKNPTIVTEAATRQIAFKLGVKNTKGGGYKNSPSTGDTEQDLKRYDYGSAYHKEVTTTAEKWHGMTKEEVEQWVMYNALIQDDPLLNQPVSEDFMGHKVNNKFIMPYADPDNLGTLQMITATQLRKIRNRLQPVMGYVVAGGYANTDYNLKKSTYETRRTFEAQRTWTNKPGRMGMEILAATSTGRSNHVQYWTGDIFGTVVREYYVPSAEWWRKNNVIGGIGRSGGISYPHLDEDLPESGGSYAGQRGYAGTLKSKAYVSLYGALPLDKEILKAYAIITPASNPDTASVGTVWSGVTHLEHYHAFWTGHEGAGGHWSEEGAMYEQSENSAVAEHDSNGGDLYPKYHRKEYPKYTVEKNEKNLIEEQYNSPSGFGVSDNNYTNEIINPSLLYVSAVKWNTNAFTDMGWWDETDRYGHYALWVHNDPWSCLKGTTGTTWLFGENLMQTKTEYQVWKHYTFDNFANIIKDHSADVDFKAESIYDTNQTRFTEFSEVALNELLPMEMQQIPGQFDLSGINSSYKYPKYVKFAEKVYDPDWKHDGQIIIQAENGKLKFLAESGPGGGSSSTSNSNNTDAPSTGISSAGREQRVLDITNVVKGVYNNRISRRFYVYAGKTIKEMFEQALPVSDNQCEADSDKLDALVWNYRCKG